MMGCLTFNTIYQAPRVSTCVVSESWPSALCHKLVIFYI